MSKAVKKMKKNLSEPEIDELFCADMWKDGMFKDNNKKYFEKLNKKQADRRGITLKELEEYCKECYDKGNKKKDKKRKVSSGDEEDGAKEHEKLLKKLAKIQKKLKDVSKKKGDTIDARVNPQGLHKVDTKYMRQVDPTINPWGFVSGQSPLSYDEKHKILSKSVKTTPNNERKFIKMTTGRVGRKQDMVRTQFGKGQDAELNEKVHEVMNMSDDEKKKWRKKVKESLKKKKSESDSESDEKPKKKKITLKLGSMKKVEDSDSEKNIRTYYKKDKK